MKKLSVADIGSSIRAHQNAGSDILRSLFDTFIRPEKEVPKPKNEGELAELGSHDELMQIPYGKYKALYEMQFQKQAVPV